MPSIGKTAQILVICDFHNESVENLGLTKKPREHLLSGFKYLLYYIIIKL